MELNISRGEKKMAALQKQKESFKGAGYISYLTEQLNISTTMLAALLEVTERSLVNWKDLNTETLQQNTKSNRIIKLYDFITVAICADIKTKLLINLLQEPINPDNDESQSILYYIINEPNSALLKDSIPLIIKRFKEETA